MALDPSLTLPFPKKWKDREAEADTSRTLLLPINILEMVHDLYETLQLGSDNQDNAVEILALVAILRKNPVLSLFFKKPAVRVGQSDRTLEEIIEELERTVHFSKAKEGFKIPGRITRSEFLSLFYTSPLVQELCSEVSMKIIDKRIEQLFIKYCDRDGKIDSSKLFAIIETDDIITSRGGIHVVPPHMRSKGFLNLTLIDNLQIARQSSSAKLNLNQFRCLMRGCQLDVEYFISEGKDMKEIRKMRDDYATWRGDSMFPLHSQEYNSQKVYPGLVQIVMQQPKKEKPKVELLKDIAHIVGLFAIEPKIIYKTIEQAVIERDLSSKSILEKEPLISLSILKPKPSKYSSLQIAISSPNELPKPRSLISKSPKSAILTPKSAHGLIKISTPTNKNDQSQSGLEPELEDLIKNTFGNHEKMWTDFIQADIRKLSQNISKKLSKGKEESKEYSNYKINQKKSQDALASLHSLGRSDLSRKLITGKGSQRSIRIADKNEGSARNTTNIRSLTPRASRLSPRNIARQETIIENPEEGYQSPEPTPSISGGKGRFYCISDNLK